MMKLIHKFLIPIFIIITMFFIGINGISAERQFGGGSSGESCTWYTYQSFITDNGTVINSRQAGDTSNQVKAYSLTYTVSDNLEGKWTVSNAFNNDSTIKLNYSSYDDSFTKSMMDGYNASTDLFSCPEYVKFDGEYLSVSNSSEFQNYIINQYDKIKIMNGDTYSYKADIFYSDNLQLTPVVFTSKNMGIGETPHFNELTSNDPDIFDKIGLSMQTRTMGNLESLSSKEFYKVSAGMWDKYINKFENNNDLRCKSEGDANCKRTINKILSLKQWFEFNWIFVLEQDYDKFKKYYRVAFSRDKTEEEMEECLKLLDTAKNIENLETQKQELLSNKCSVYCTLKPGIAQNECRKNNQDYINCNDAHNWCKANANYVYDSCLKNRIGEQKYNELNQKYNERIEQINEEIEKDRKTIRDNQLKINESLSGVSINGYKANCEDVVVFHTIYNIMVIVAPILVILLGSIDYAKAVFSTDEKKMEESKKKFPKRLLLLVLFVAVPTIIRIILGISNGETTLMDCIIRGK